MTAMGPGSLWRGFDKIGRNLHSDDGGKTWKYDEGQNPNPVQNPTGSYSGKVVGQEYIGGGSPNEQAAPPTTPPLTMGLAGYNPFPPAGLAGMSTIPGLARGGEIHSDAAEDRAQTLGILKEKNLIKRRGGRLTKFAEGGDLEEPPAKKSPRAVLMRKPLGHHAMPIPILHTTIVIATKPKPKKTAKKKKGGAIKASALPPAKGPGNGSEPPAPYRKGGHVQVPRGSGAAIRGKRFGGIY
jgi:hypothetical protein